MKKMLVNVVGERNTNRVQLTTHNTGQIEIHGYMVYEKVRDLLESFGSL